MKLYLMGDLHFGVHVNALKWLDMQRAYFYDYLMPYIRETMEPGDEAVLLGDIFENKHFLNVNILKAARGILKDLADVIPVHIIAGNHDIYYLHDNEVNSVDMLGEMHEGLHVYTSDPTEVKSWGGARYLMIPWVQDVDRLAGILDDHQDSFDYAFAHMDVQGMKYDNNRPIRGGVSVKSFRNYKRVYSGHIHWRQESGNLLYVGTPYQTERSDRGNRKGLYLLHIEDGRGVVREEFVPNEFSPVYKQINCFQAMEMSVEQLRDELASARMDILWESNFARRYNHTQFMQVIRDNKIEYAELEFPPYTASLDEELGAEVPDGFDLRDLGQQILRKRGYGRTEIGDSLAYYDELEERLIENEKLKIKQ